MKNRFALFAAAGVAIASASAAHAATSFLSEWNLILAGDLTTTSETDASTIIGGNLTGTSNYSVHFVSASDNTGLAVGGNVLSGNLQINNGGDFRLTGANVGGGAINLNGGGSLISDPAVPARVASLIAQAQSAQTYFAGLTANGSVDGGGNFNAVPTLIGADNVAVYSINGSQIESLGGINLSFGSATTVIINYYADNGMHVADLTAPPNFTGGFGSQSNSSKILWNFVDATTININNNFNGAILAPDAHINLTGGGINGSVVAASMYMTAEVRQNLYTGHMPAPGAGVALAIAGLGLAGRRRR